MGGKIACCLHIVLFSFFSGINEVATVLWTSLPIPMPACVRRVMPVLPWQDARRPGDASVPRGHHGELGILEESPGRETRPRIAFLSLAGSSYCCSRVQYTWASIGSPVIPRKKKNVFPEGC